MKYAPRNHREVAHGSTLSRCCVPPTPRQLCRRGALSSAAVFTVLHICAAEQWSAVPEGGSYRAASLDDVGFVHCSDRGTVHLPANRLFAGRTDLVLLEIDIARVDAPVRWEPPLPPETDAMPWYPHIYGPVSRGAVVRVHDFKPRADGTFGLPGTLVNPPDV